MAMLILDGPHGTGKTTLVQETCPDLPQPRSTRPEDLESDFRAWIERWATSDDIAVFDHFSLFSHPVKLQDPTDTRFHAEYHISPETLNWAKQKVRAAQEAGKALIIHAHPPAAALREGQERPAQLFEEVFKGWDALVYDWTNEDSRKAAQERIREFIDANSGASADRPQRRRNAKKGAR